MGTTNTLDRLAASVGLLMEAKITFQPCADVPHGGVLLALPALLANGLLSEAKRYFQLPKGYYGLESILLLLAMMALARLTSLEDLRYEPPGEWGKLLGLDRIPEVRTLRNKIKLLVGQGVEAWSAELCKGWMQNDPQSTGAFYVDGHVRVYHGKQTKLPRHYVARERLCLRATTDYWVNAMDGQPFFRVTKTVDPGLLQVLEKEIVPRLEQDFQRLCISSTGKTEQTPSRPLYHPRFTLIYDREGYSPGFMQRMRKRGIACISYHKHPGEPWPEFEFHAQKVTLASGEVVDMELAERGVCVGGEAVWMREIRKRSSSGQQTSVLCTHDGLGATEIAASMFARWCQENFFGYMRKHYGLDHLITHTLDEISGDILVVNPEHRQLDGQVRSKVGVLQKKMAEFGDLNLKDVLDEKKVKNFECKKALLQQTIEDLSQEVAALKQKRKETARHILVSELPEEHRFKSLSADSKHFIDTIKMVAYRAETAMASIIREHMARTNDVRALLQGLYVNSADIIPNANAGTLTVRLHHLASPVESKALASLCEQLNTTQTYFPGTELQLVYELISTPAPMHIDKDQCPPSSIEARA
jgi:uncharacterized coiled-coil protein SlyX